MAEDNNFKNTVNTLFDGMEGFLTSKTVVGEPVKVGDATIIPLVDVSFGVGAGANEGDRKAANAGGGIGGKMSPSAVLVIANGTTKIISVRNQDSFSKIMDMVPDMINKFAGKGKNEEEKKEQ